MTVHRTVRATPGQELLAVLGVTLWRSRRKNGDELVIRALRHPRPHLKIEVWRDGTEHAVCLLASELADVAAAMLAAPRALCRRDEPDKARSAER